MATASLEHFCQHWVRWHMPIIPDLRKLSWEDGRFRVSLLHYLVNLRLV